MLLVCTLCSMGCGSQSQIERSSDLSSILEGDDPLSNVQTIGGVTLGEPIAVTTDFDGNILVADGGAPGQVVHLVLEGGHAVEFAQPSSSPSFYPTDLEPSGFFVYVVDQVERLLLRFYKTGSYVDVLIDLEAVFPGRHVTPFGLDVDGSGRVALTDVKNHQVIVFNTYLDVELQFGNYGRFAGQFDTPEGVSFTPGDGFLVTDSGNRRVQFFDPEGGFSRIVPDGLNDNPLKRPRRAVMDGDDRIYVADPEAGHVFVFDESGKLIRSIFPKGSSGFRPTDVAVTPSGIIYVTDEAASSLYTFR
jgi:sugar lactone lactonase YvrE